MHHLEGYFMTKEFSRIQRINQQVQQELAIVLQRDVKDPRLGMVTVNEVEVSRDLSFARVFVTFFELESAEDSKDAKVQILQKAAPYIRTLVASRIQLRVMPELRFVYDKSLDEGIRLSNLATEAVRHDKQKQSNTQGDDE